MSTFHFARHEDMYGMPTILGRAQLANHMQFFQTCKLTYVITTNPFRYFEDGGAQSASDQHLPNKNYNRCKLKDSVEIHIALRNPGKIPPSTSHAANDGSDGQCPPGADHGFLITSCSSSCHFSF